MNLQWERMGAGVPPGLQNRVWRLWAPGGFDSHTFPPFLRDYLNLNSQLILDLCSVFPNLYATLFMGASQVFVQNDHIQSESDLKSTLFTISRDLLAASG